MKCSLNKQVYIKQAEVQYIYSIKWNTNWQEKITVTNKCCNKDESQPYTIIEIRKVQHIQFSPTVSKCILSGKEHVRGDLGMRPEGGKDCRSMRGNFGVLLKMFCGLIVS